MSILKIALLGPPEVSHFDRRLFQLFGEPLGKGHPLLVQLSLDMRSTGVLREGLNTDTSSYLTIFPYEK
jgi:hypothetical protein